MPKLILGLLAATCGPLLLASCGGSVGASHSSPGSGGDAGGSGLAGATTGGGGAGTGGRSETGGTAGTGGDLATGGVGGGSGSGGSGGSAGGDGGSATGGSAGSPPTRCEVDTAAAPPYPTRFVLTNTQAFPVYLFESCWLDHSIRACADDFAEELQTQVFCSLPCDAVTGGGGCIVCGACLEQAIRLAPGESHELDWNGLSYTTRPDGSGCSCHESHPVSAGVYRIEVPIAMNEEDAQLHQPGFHVVQEFTLPATDGVVEVELYVGF